MSPHRLLPIALILMFGCGSAPAARADAPAKGEQGKGADGAVEAAVKGADAEPRVLDWSERLFQVKTEQALEPVASLGWGLDGALRLGFADAKLGVVDFTARKSELKRLEDEPSRVIFASPAGELVLLDARPPRLLRVADGREVLRMNHIPGAALAAAWHPSGQAFFVTEPTGKLHIWKVSEEQLRRLPDETIQMFLNRQLPDYTGHLPEMAGPLVVRPDGLVLFGDIEGHLLRWNPQQPTDVELVIKLEGTATTLATQGERLCATSTTGQLRVADLKKNAFMPWSMKATGQYVAAHHDGELMIVARQGELVALRGEDGREVWRAKVAQATSCGLAVSRDGQSVAACFDDKVLRVRVSDGELLSLVGRYQDELRWL
jgi:hypothetical protein